MSTERTGGHTEASPLLGVIFMLVATGLMAADSLIVKHLAGSVHPFVMAFTRALFGLLAFLPWILSRRDMLTSHYRFRHVLRAALKLASLVAFFVAFVEAPLADVTAIAFTSPIFVTVGAWLFLTERPRAMRILAVGLGFVGVLIILRPGSAAGISTGLLFALLGAILTATIQLILKPMSARDSTETLVAWNLIVTVPLAAIPALIVWQTPSGSEWGWLALQGVLGAISMGCVTRAFSLAEASLLVPLDFLRLPLVAVLGFVIFAETVPISTWAGGAVIFAATLVMARSARRPS